MNTLIEFVTSHPVVTALIVIIGVLVLALIFLLGYRTGLTRALTKYLKYLQKDHEHRRIIRMQAMKPNKRIPGYPYMGCVSYSKKKTRKNIARHRRNRWGN